MGQNSTKAETFGGNKRFDRPASRSAFPSRPPSPQTQSRTKINRPHQWPRWASTLTHGLPPEGDKGLFRGEFILVQAPPTPGVRRGEEPHPRARPLFGRPFRSRVFTLPGSPESYHEYLYQLRRKDGFQGHYNTVCRSDAGPLHLRTPDPRISSLSFYPGHELGHITEEDEDLLSSSMNNTRNDGHDDDSEDDVFDNEDDGGNFMDADHAANTFHKCARSRSKETSSIGRTYRDRDKPRHHSMEHRRDEPSVQIDRGLYYSSTIGHFTRNKGIHQEVPCYFANQLVKPFFVSSGPVGVNRSRPRSRDSQGVKTLSGASRSLPRKTNDYVSPLRMGRTSTLNKRLVISDKDRYSKAYLSGSQDNLDNNGSHNTSKNEIKLTTYNCSTEGQNLIKASNLLDVENRPKRPTSPLKDYSSSESGISEQEDIDLDNLDLDLDIDNPIQESITAFRQARNTIRQGHVSLPVKYSTSQATSFSTDSALRDSDFFSSFGSGTLENTDRRNLGYRSSSEDGVKRNQRSDESSRRSSNMSNGSVFRPDDSERKPRSRYDKHMTQTRNLINSGRQIKSPLPQNVITVTGRQNNVFNDKINRSREAADGSESASTESIASLTSESDSDTSPHPHIAARAMSEVTGKSRNSSLSVSRKSVAFADIPVTKTCESLTRSQSEAAALNFGSSIDNQEEFKEQVLRRSQSTPEKQNISFDQQDSDEDSFLDNSDCTEEKRVESVKRLAKVSNPLYKTGRSKSAHSFLSSAKCTDRIKQLQSVLIEQALPFANPEALLSRGPNGTVKTPKLSSKSESALTFHRGSIEGTSTSSEKTESGHQVKKDPVHVPTTGGPPPPPPPPPPPAPPAPQTLAKTNNIQATNPPVKSPKKSETSSISKSKSRSQNGYISEPSSLHRKKKIQHEHRDLIASQTIDTHF